MPDEVLLVERRGPVSLITINRPRVFNALNSAVLAALSTATAGAVSTGARAVVITGAGEKAFSAGADLDEVSGLDARAGYRLLRSGQQVLAQIERSPVPVITAVNGFALGGGFELVLASTFPVLSTTASLGLPESGLGLVPGYGGTQRLPRAIGKAAAAHAMLTGSRIDAARAYQLGLTPIPPVPPADLVDTAVATGESIAAKGPEASEAILTALHAGLPPAVGFGLEAGLGAIAMASEEAAEGVAAFLGKRPAAFATTGRTARR